MSRGVDPDLLDAMVAQGGWPVMLIKIALDSGTRYLGWGFIGYLGDTFTSGDSGESPTWIGLGEVGNIAFAEEKMNAFAQGILYSISGIDPSNNTEIPGFRDALGASMNEPIRGRSVQLFIACLSRSMALLAPPFMLRNDIGASLTLIDDGSKLELQMSAKPKTFDYRRHRRRLYARADWRNLHPDSSLMDDDTWRRRSFPWGQRGENT